MSLASFRRLGTRRPVREDEEMGAGLSDLGEAYVFVRTGFFLAEHNYKLTRRFVGALAGGRAEGLPVMLLPEDEPGFVSPFAAAKFSDPVEREGELIRRDAAPGQCSRLGGVFVFTDLDSCRRASSLYDWDEATVRKGRAYGTWSSYDMQVISVLRMPGLSSSTRQALWRHYWTNEPGMAFEGWDDLLTGSPDHRGPLWEWMVDGVVQFEPEDRAPFTHTPR